MHKHACVGMNMCVFVCFAYIVCVVCVFVCSVCALCVRVCLRGRSLCVCVCASAGEVTSPDFYHYGMLFLLMLGSMYVCICMCAWIGMFVHKHGHLDKQRVPPTYVLRHQMLGSCVTTSRRGTASLSQTHSKWHMTHGRDLAGVW